MANYDSHSPRTTKTRLALPLNGTIFTTTREVASEKPFPVIGDTMAAELGTAYAASRIIAVSDGPDRAKGVLTITHATIPTEAEQLASNWEHTTCDIGGQRFDAVSRTVILLASAYSETVPATGSVMPSGTPFTAANYLLENRQTVRSGMELEPTFRVERRTYVKRVTISEVNTDEATGIGQKSVTTLYYRGETISGNTIESLIADGANAYWKTGATGFANTGQQLSENWFSVTNRPAVRTDTSYRKTINQLRPDKFFTPEQTSTETVTIANATTGTPSISAPGSGNSITIEKTGHVQRTETTTQAGNPVALKSLDYLSDDGKIYPGTQELVTLASVPTEVSAISATGTVIQYEPINASDAVKVTKQALSLEEKGIALYDHLLPDNFYAPNQIEKTVETSTTGAYTLGTPTTGKSQQVEAKGQIFQRTTTEQQGTLSPNKGTNLEGEVGKSFLETIEIVPIGEVAETSVDANGQIVLYEPLNATHSKKRTLTVVDSTMDLEWTEMIHFPWPPVLKSIVWHTWPRRNGEPAVQIPYAFYKTHGSSQSVATIRQTWSPTPPAAVPQLMIPEGFHFRCPYWELTLDSCLHGEFPVSVSTGTHDIEWDYATADFVVPATTPSDWPESFTWQEARPHMGGYLVKTITVVPPSPPAP